MIPLEQAARHLRRNLAGTDLVAAYLVLDELRWQTEHATQLAAQVAELRRLQTLGGPPPPCNDTAWTNTRHPGGVHDDYQGLA